MLFVTVTAGNKLTTRSALEIRDLLTSIGIADVTVKHLKAVFTRDPEAFAAELVREGFAPRFETVAQRETREELTALLNA